MFPFIITWTSKDLIENDYKNYYGYVNEINDIIGKLNDLIINILKLLECKIKNSLYYGDLNWSKFCEIVNNQPYNYSIFFDIKYFNIGDNKWYNYEIDDIDLEKNFIKTIGVLFNKKITYSTDIINKFDKVNIIKNKKILNQQNIKEILTVDL